MDNQVKKQIVEAAKSYASENGLVQESIADLAGINIGYVNAMWQGNFSIKGKEEGKSTIIKDLYFKKVAKAVGFDYEQRYWGLVETPQYLEIYTELADAKNKGYMKMIIGETGCGKTFTVDKFVKDFPANVYKITVSNLYTIDDIINELCEKVGVNVTRGRVGRLKRVSDKLKNMQLNNQKPVVIIDEAENLQKPALKMMKSLYDSIKNYCSIVLIGTDQLINKLDALSEKNEDGIPQFCRRFKAGKRNLPPINKDKMFLPFLERINDEGLRKTLIGQCDNYGELNDFLEPALREADAFGVELTEQFLCNMFGLNRA